MKYLGDVAEELNINTAKSYAESGVDVFNASDEFFNDLCHKYDNNNGMDIIIKDRRTDIYINVSFCQDSCTYIGMDYELMTANCKCDSNFIQGTSYNDTDNDDNNNNEGETLSFKTLEESVLSNIFPFDIDVIYCYNLLLEFKKLKSNIGFIIMSIMLLLQIIFLFIYLVKKLRSLKSFMLTFNINQSIRKSFPPPKNNIIKNIYAENENRIKQNLKIQNYKKEEPDSKSKLNSKRRLQFMDDNDNYYYLKQLISKENINNDKNNILNQKKDKQLIVNNNFGPIINIPAPALNINDKNKNQIKGKMIKIIIVKPYLRLKQKEKEMMIKIMKLKLLKK